MRVNFYLNGQALVIDIAATTRLIDVLRDDLQITSVKEGCGIGECGACTVLVNGDAVNACLVLTGQLEGAHVETVEGLSKNGDLHPLQEAFIEHGAVHCGYCTPGMMMSAVALLRKNPHPTDEEIRAAVAGNLCRCTGYVQIIDAIQATAAEEAKA